MADTATANPPAKGGGGKAFWTHKLGPFPVWVWGLGVGAVGAYYWYTHYGPGAKKGQSSGQGQQARRGGGPQRTRVVETIRYYGGRRGGRRPGTARATRYDPAVAAASAAPDGGAPGFGGTMAGMPAPPGGPNPGGPNQRPGGGGRPGRRRDQDRDRDRDADAQRRRAGAEAVSRETVTRTGQAVAPDTGQPVYWEWQHAHRPPEVATPVPAPVPEPQHAYAPMTSGATYDAASAAAELAG